MSNKLDLCSGLNEAAQRIHADAKQKGFWDSERETGTLLMLMVSELAEALEADRHGRYANRTTFACNPDGKSEEEQFRSHIKDTLEDEMADTMIRILDFCGAKGIDIEWHINQKLAYNRTREHRHGKAY
ncbi:MAG: hypothetical protein PHU27_02635 [Salinivirgaceae bacterium]|nr:hypothetical protein [Salinivirgaceae bacterium]